MEQEFNVGTRLEEWVKLNGIKWGHLEKTTGISQYRMYLIRSGSKKVRAEELELLEKVTGIKFLN